MTPKRARVVAVAMVAAYLGFATYMFVVAFSNSEFLGFINRSLVDDILQVVVFFVFILTGSAIVARAPRNRMGWLFASVGLLAIIGASADLYTIYADRVHSGNFPLRDLAAWLGSWVWAPMFGTAVFLIPNLFPTGRPPSPRWRWFIWVLGFTMVVIIVYSAFAADETSQAPYVNPWTVPVIERFVAPIAEILFLATPLMALITAISFISRFRNSRGTERQQLKWFAAGVAFLAASVVVQGVFEEVLDIDIPWFIDVLVTLGLAGLPITAGIAILRYRLYDIDVIINRALVYGALTGLLGAFYVGVVALVGSVAGNSNLTVAAATLAVAGLFQPLRSRLQGFIDRRFYRRKFDAQRTVDEFALRLRDEVDLNTLSDDLVGVVSDTMQPRSISLWLRVPEGSS